jgi:8-oxo-dGTP pyrophosphatase MutT (NUDIX family)
VQRQGKFLLVEESINGKIVINQPAGHLENNESLIVAVIRETLEETRWEFSPLYVSGIYRWVHNNGETYLRVCFVGDVIKEYKERNLDTEIQRVVWLTQYEILQHENMRSPLVIKSIEDYLAGQKFPLSLIQDID